MLGDLWLAGPYQYMHKYEENQQNLCKYGWNFLHKRTFIAWSPNQAHENSILN